MLDLTIEYECAFEKSAPETVPEIRVSEVERCHISNRAKNNFYAYQRAFLKDRTPSAAYALGVFYRHRHPCGQWLTRALEYFTSAAENGYCRPPGCSRKSTAKGNSTSWNRTTPPVSNGY